MSLFSDPPDDILAGLREPAWKQEGDWNAPAVERLVEENKVLRKLLWLRHGCPLEALYWDDGEQQCSACGIDFKRQAPEDIEQIWKRKLRRVMEKGEQNA